MSVSRLRPPTSPADLPGSLADLFAAATSGQLTPGEASALAGLLAEWRTAVETTDLADRLAALERSSKR